MQKACRPLAIIVADVLIGVLALIIRVTSGTAIDRLTIAVFITVAVVLQLEFVRLAFL